MKLNQMLMKILVGLSWCRVELSLCEHNKTKYVYNKFYEFVLHIWNFR